MKCFQWPFNGNLCSLCRIIIDFLSLEDLNEYDPGDNAEDDEDEDV